MLQNALRVRDTMTDDHRFGYPKHRRTAIQFEVEAVEVLVFDAFAMGDVVDRFSHFQDHITGKAFANHHVGFIFQHIPAFHIAGKVDLGVVLQQGIGALRQEVTLTFFFTNIQQSYPGIVNAQDMLCIEGTQDGKLVQVSPVYSRRSGQHPATNQFCRFLWE